MDLGWAGQVPATWKEPVGSRDNHGSGGDESGHLRGKGGIRASRDSLTHLGKASENSGLFIIKSVKKKKNRMVKIQSLTVNEGGQWEVQRRCFLKPQEKK